MRPVVQDGGQGSWERGWQTWKPMLWHSHHRPIPALLYPYSHPLTPHGGMCFTRHRAQASCYFQQPHSCLGRK